jgi:serine/alanine adding enzyme
MKLTINQCPGSDEVESFSDFLFKNVSFSVFQSIEFFNFLKNEKNAKPFQITTWDERDKITGSLLAVRFSYKKGYPGFLSDRTVIWGGPLLFGKVDDQKRALEMLLDALVKECANKSAIIEFRNMFDLTEFEEIFLKFGFHFSGQMNCIVPIFNKADVLDKMKDTKLRQIKKGLDRGALISEVKNLNQVKEFYVILKSLYDEKVRKPLPDFSFFENFYLWGKENGLGVLLLVLFEDKVIGGSLCPITENKEIFEWYTVALIKDYSFLYPGVLAAWAPIDYALNHGIPAYNLMGIGKPEIPYGVRDFKLQFGGDVVNFGRFTRINNPNLFKITKAGYRLMGFRE